MNITNSEIQCIEKILSKSPISITKNEQAQLIDLILTHRLYIYVMPLLRMQEFYLYFNIPLSIKNNIDLLSYFEQERINFLELIGFVYFNFGSQVTFFRNLVLFKYKKFPRLKEKSQLQLNAIIGEILSPLWWHYELFKINARNLNPFLYHQLAFTIQRHQQNRDQKFNIYTISKISKYYSLIISNSIEESQSQEELSKNCDNYIQNLLKIDQVNLEYLMNYIEQSSRFSLKRRAIYNKLLFYFWQVSRQTKQPITQSANVIKSESLIVKGIQPFSSSSMRSSIQLQSAIFQKQNSSITSKNRVNLLFLYLNENIESFSEELCDENLEIQFKIILETHQQQIQELKNYEKEDLQFFLTQDQLFQQVQKILNDTYVECLIPLLQGSRNKLLQYTIILQQNTEQLIKNQQLIQNIIINNKQRENSTVTDEFRQFHSLLNDKTPLEQLGLLNLVCYEKQFTKIQQNIFWRCLQIRIKDHYTMIELALRLKSIQTIYDCQFHRLWLANIQSNEWQLLNQAVHQQCLIEVFYLILQCLVENQKDQADWRKIIINLLQIIDISYSQDVILNLFKFSMIDLKFLSDLISLSWPLNFSSEQVEIIIEFLQNVLQLEEQSRRLLILKGFSMIVPFSTAFQLAFLIDEINQNPKSLISYVKIKFFKASNQNSKIITIAQELHENDFQFYKKFITSEDTPGFDLRIVTEIKISQTQAVIFNKRLIDMLKTLTLEEYQQQIQQLILSQKISNRTLMKELDELILIKKSKQFSEKDLIEYMINQKEFIVNYVEKKIRITLMRISKEIKLVQQKIQSYVQWKTIISSLNKNLTETLFADNYFQDDVLDKFSCSKLLSHLLFSILDKKYCFGISFLKKQYQQIFEAFQAVTNTQRCTKEEFINEFLLLESEQLDVPVLKPFLNYLEIQMTESSNEFQKMLKELNDTNFEEQIQDLKLSLIGCQEVCPLCRRKCDQNVLKKHKHKCSLGHQLRSMGGVIVDGKLSLLSCEEIKDNYLILDIQNNTYHKWFELKQKYKKWSFEPSDSNKQYLMNIWNDQIGQIMCNRLNIQFRPKFDDEYQFLTHYIFVIDESLSMAGQNWKNVVNASEQCLIELGQKNNVRVTFIQFSDDARLIVGQQSPEIIDIDQQISKLEMTQAGGTDFENAFQLLFYVIQCNINQFEKYVFSQSRQIILFFTDGDAEYPEISMNLFGQLQECYIKNTSILLCSEQIFSKSLQNVQNFLTSKLYTCRLMQSVKSIQLPEIWRQEVSDKY